MLEHRNFARGRLRLESFEIFATPETTCLFKQRTVSAEKTIIFSINGIDFKKVIKFEEGKDPYADLENSFFDGERIICKYRFKDDIVDGTGNTIDVAIQLKGWLVCIELI